MPQRCAWAGNDPLMIDYHDREWGVPIHDDRRLFEFLILEGAQAGLAWRTILNKRAAFREAFAGFDPAEVARFTDDDVARLLANPGIVRNRAKIQAAIGNARAFLDLQAEHHSFDRFVWQFTGGRQIVHHVEAISQVPVRTAESDALSMALLRRGFKFVGSTICYALMQAAGLVNDHELTCFRRNEVASG